MEQNSIRKVVNLMLISWTFRRIQQVPGCTDISLTTGGCCLDKGAVCQSDTQTLSNCNELIPKSTCLRAQFSPQINEPKFRLGKKAAVQGKLNLVPMELLMEDALGWDLESLVCIPAAAPSSGLLLTLQYLPQGSEVLQTPSALPLGYISLCCTCFCWQTGFQVTVREVKPSLWGLQRARHWPDLPCKEL